MALLTKGTAQGDESRCSNIHSISAKGDSLGYISAVSDATGNHY
jgi:hypothetical protein